ncbi:MAG: hypothetical protein ACTHN5_07505 [Phycisphaerae bacterium]
MTESEVKVVAEEFVERQKRQTSCVFKLVGIEEDRTQRRQWVAVFEWRENGSVVDSGPIVLVDDETGTAKYFE